MTSLQKQLAAIAASSTNELDLKAQKASHSQSLLFEPGIAATQSFDTIFQLCFEAFEDSKNEDRVQMTRKENEKLNGVLESYLGLVGGRLLLKPALKTVEWLVRRFRIHEYNTEALILTFLPYHDTYLFSTLLSILPKELSPSFKFLHPYKAQIKSPSRHVIVHAAVTNSGFFVALNRYTVSVSKVHHHHIALLSFWASIVAQAIDGKLGKSQSGRQKIQYQREEDIFTQILPILNEALSLKKVPELVIACYMIITILVSKTDLSDATLDAFMVTIIRSWTPETVEPGLGCLAIVVERSNSASLPKAVVKAVLKLDLAVEKIIALSSHQPVRNLVIGLATSIVSGFDSEKPSHRLEVLTKILKSQLLEDSDRTNLIRWTTSQVDQAIEKRFVDPKQLNAFRTLLLEEIEPDSGIVPTTETNDLDVAMANVDDGAADQPYNGEPFAINASSFERTDSFLSLEGAGALADAISSNALLEHRPNLFEGLLALPFFQGNETRQVRMRLSLMARVWTMSRIHVNSRCAALRAAATELPLLRGPEDVAALLPLALIALADESKKVREQAGRFFTSLSSFLQGLDQVKLKSRGSGDILQKMYGDVRAQPKPLNQKDLLKFIDSMVMPSLEECIQDPNGVSKVLRGALDSSIQQDPANIGRHGTQLKSNEKTDVYSWLCSHANSMDMVEPKFRLLLVLEGVEKVKGQPRSKFLLQSFKEWTKMKPGDIEAVLQHNGIDVQKLDAIFLAIVHASDEDAVQHLLSLASNGEFEVRDTLLQGALQRLRQLWSLLGSLKQEKVAEALLHVAHPITPSPSTSLVQESSSEFLKSISINSDILHALLSQSLDVFKHEDQQPAAKRRKKESVHTEHSNRNEEHLGPRLARLTFCLDLVEVAPLVFHLDLFLTLFRCAHELQRLIAQNVTQLGYAQSTTLAALLSLMDHYEVLKQAPTLDVAIVRPDILVDCIRTTKSPQVRSSSLLLVARLAKYMPQNVLQSVIPIFTLMSASTAKQQDELSIHVVDETIQEVIPLLVKSIRQQNQDVVAATSEIIENFASVYDHIPSHRRLKLFKLLVSTLGAADCLYAVLSCLVARHPGNPEVVKFSVALMQEFSSFENLTTLYKCVDILIASLQNQESHFWLLTQSSHVVDNIESIRQDLVSASILFLRQQVSRSQLYNDISNKGDIASSLITVYGRLLERSIVLARIAAHLPKIRAGCEQVLENLLQLLPFDHFIASITPLLDNTDLDIRRSVIRALNHQVSKQKEQGLETAKAATKFLPRLTEVLNTTDTSLRCSAVSCIDEICEKFGRTDLDAVMETANAVSTCIKVEFSTDLFISLCLYCIASMVETLQNDFIPLLQPVMGSATECLEASITQFDSTGDAGKVHNGAYALFISVLESIPYMFPQEKLASILQLSSASAATISSKSCSETRQQFLRSIASKMDIRIIFEVSRDTQLTAINCGLRACQEHVDLLSSAIEMTSKSRINHNIRGILDVFLLEFDFRRLAKDVSLDASLATKDIDLVEEKVVSTFVSLTLKINDTILRPFFVRFVEWTGENLPKSGPNAKLLRSQTMFRVLLALSDRLKSLITMYFNYVLDAMVDVLQETSQRSTDKQTLTPIVLQTLTSGFKYDQDDFWQAPSRYNAVMPALVAQLVPSNAPSGAKADLMQTHVIPAIVELAATAMSPENHKQMNEAILKLLRSESSRTRLTAVKCQQELTRRVGDEWLAQLPAMLPVISELQEDDDEKVERETSRWIKLIEDVLGESLNSMLT